MLFILAAAAAALAAAPSAPAAAVPATLKAADGVSVAGRFYAAAKPKAIVLLFRQAGSSKDEYATIAPRLAALGYNALAIDQRSGGALFGPNETAAAVAVKPSFEAAQKDLEAAYGWAAKRREPIVLWGSSYSAALVFRVAAAHPGKVAAVLAFSPGEYLDGPPSVAASAARLTAPLFVTSASVPGEIAAARAIVGAARSRIRQQYVPTVGVHGSSTLIVMRDPRGAGAAWQAVRAFLARAMP